MSNYKKNIQQTLFGFVIIAVVAIGYLFFVKNQSTYSPDIEPSVTKVYFADHISPAHQLVIDKFNEKYRGKIEVIPVNLPFEKFSTNERKELLARSLRSKSDRLDVFTVDYIWVPRFAKWCLPLDEYFPKNERDKILSYALKSCIYDSALVAMPLYIDIGMMYYRRDLLQKLPHYAELEEKLKRSITWDEFLALRTALHYTGNNFYIFQADDYEGLVCNYLELCVARDENFLTHNTINLKSTTAHEALQQLVDFVHTIQISPRKVVEFDENMSYTHLLDNNGLFVRGWPNFIENFRKNYSDTTKLNAIGRAALPHFKGKKPVSVFGGWNLMIAQTSTKKKEALEFIRFLQTEEIQKILFEHAGFIPVNTSVYSDSLYMNHYPDLAYYRQLLNRGFHRPAMIEYTKVSDIISHFVRLAINRELSVDEALRQASLMISSNKVLIK